MRVGRIGRGAAAGLLLAACVVVGCAASGKGPQAEDEDLPEFSAARLGDAGSGSMADDDLTPAEREAAKGSWATEHPTTHKPLDDPAEDDPFAEKEVVDPNAPPKGAFARAMDTTGKFFVAIGSVSVSLFMALAPMLAMMGA